MVALFGRLKQGDPLSDAESSTLAKALGVDVADLNTRVNGADEVEPEPVDESVPTILLTSLMGSKGLQAAHVFIVGMNEEHFPRDNAAPTNEEVCQLLVALTRARKSCTLVSTNRYAGQIRRGSLFTNWLRPHIGGTQYVDKSYLEQIGSGASG
jgi:superfamily I DNA/RNA helicase